MSEWQLGDRVVVNLPTPKGDKGLPGEIDKIQDPGPHQPTRTHRVRFDDPMVFGGMGVAWFDPKLLSKEQA